MAVKPMTKEVQRHNETLLAQLEPGDLIEFPRGVYSHWAVYIGNEEVVHLSGDNVLAVSGQSAASPSTIPGRASVKVENFWKVVKGCLAQKNNSKDQKYRPFPKKDIVQRAMESIGYEGYNILLENCEHFSSWCRYNMTDSEQVNTLLKGAAVSGAIAAVLWLLFQLSMPSSKEKPQKS